MPVHRYTVTVKEGDEAQHVRTAATSPTAAKKIVCEFWKCPPGAILDVIDEGAVVEDRHV